MLHHGRGVTFGGRPKELLWGWGRWVGLDSLLSQCTQVGAVKIPGPACVTEDESAFLDSEKTVRHPLSNGGGGALKSS